MGVNYFPLVDIVKIVNGTVEVSGDQLLVDILNDETVENGCYQKLIHKVDILHPTFQEAVRADAAAIIEDNPNHVLFAKNMVTKNYIHRYY
ncbi:hypothetical protein KHA80_12700 [Anaerobacillus sp. HL2]|nr:hypothetical protein KHA80_12700 [Anaerobacillus sp. HL2]